MGDFVLEMNRISKSYGENQVLKDVSLNIKPGEIHALLGENGAGKSTLMNILFGMPVITALSTRSTPTMAMLSVFDSFGATKKTVPFLVLGASTLTKKTNNSPIL